MGVCVVEVDASDCSSNDEECSSCWGTSSSTKTTKSTTKAPTKANESYYYDSDKAETLHRNAKKPSGKCDAHGGCPTASCDGSMPQQTIYQSSAKDLVGNCKEFRIEQNRQNLRIIGNGNRVRILHNTGNLQIIGNNTRLKIIDNSGHIKYTGNNGRIYLSSDSAQQTVDYIGCNGILKIVKSTELQASAMPKSKTSKKKTEKCATSQQQQQQQQQHEEQATNENARAKPKFKSASFGGCGGGVGVNVGAATSNWQQFEKRFQNLNATHNSSSAAYGLTGVSVNNSLPNLSMSVNCGNIANKESSFEINNKLTVVNNVGGNIVINNAINTNRMMDFEVMSPPDDSVSALEFSPATMQQNFLIAGSWDNSVRCWEVEQTGKTVPKSMKTMGGPVLDVCWSDEGTKVFVASCDKQVKMWDLASDQVMQVAAHDGPVKTCHWIKGGNCTCLMTGSWDKTLKFWDTRSPNPIMVIHLPERCYCADVDYPMAVVGTAGRGLIIYSLENTLSEYKRQESPLKYQHRTIAIFKDKKKAPTGYALGSIEGRVAIQYVNPVNPKDNFTFKCHRATGTTGFQDIYAVNDIAFHPIHGTLVTVGSDGTFSFWDKDARTKLKSSESMDQSITKCGFNANGQIFAYAVGYDWSKGHEFFNPAKKPQIFLRSCFDELKPRIG